MLPAVDLDDSADLRKIEICLTVVKSRAAADDVVKISFRKDQISDDCQVTEIFRKDIVIEFLCRVVQVFVIAFNIIPYRGFFTDQIYIFRS